MEFKEYDFHRRLAERFGPVICKRVDFGPLCKDSNEFLCRFDSIDLRELINDAPMYPLPGIVEPEDLQDDIEKLYEEGASSGYETGWKAAYFTPKNCPLYHHETKNDFCKLGQTHLYRIYKFSNFVVQFKAKPCCNQPKSKHKLPPDVTNVSPQTLLMFCLRRY